MSTVGQNVSESVSEDGIRSPHHIVQLTPWVESPGDVELRIDVDPGSVLVADFSETSTRWHPPDGRPNRARWTADERPDQRETERATTQEHLSD